MEIEELEETLQMLFSVTEQNLQAITKNSVDIATQTERQQIAFDRAVNTLHKAVQDAVMASMAQSKRDVSVHAKNALDSAVIPFLESVNAVVNSVNEIEVKLKKSANETEEKLNKSGEDITKAASSFSWAWLRAVSGVIIVGIFAVFIVANTQLWFASAELKSLKEQAVTMERNIEQLRKRKGDISFNFCGKNKRPCVEVDKDQGYLGADGDKDRIFYILKGVK